ncbi:Sensory box protein/GGDEF domain protein [Methyloversatilis universalis FAM5]|uniref:Sensory box protein/GGDEF domain protein n=1 Tax=Methyloversatilis universalis (strain ATCC BAA-1314 / DSM 25237 / JCM 13912 / CCUG 52030 / FAM5) TaxID=1000565 RepID=F5RD42_METUF|nr:EAL domain-containing protein [Methyloversatilis universalis]EGK71513.1 Sensory box protein/GGDEF domain protein [Methyloversatilis universalis FAM5]
MALDLIKATALLLALSLLVGLNARVWRQRLLARQIVEGLIYGGICVVGMMMPITLAPGLIFDGRSAVLSMGALFGGPVAGGIAGLIAGSYRLSLGGTGATVGFSVIALSVLSGLALRLLIRGGKVREGFFAFLCLGTVVHLAALLLFMTFPSALARQVLDELALPYLLTLAPATALLGMLLLDLERRRATDEALVASEARMRAITEAIPDVLMVIDEDGRYRKIRAPDSSLLAAGIDRLDGQLMSAVLPPDKTALFQRYIERTLKSDATEVLEYSLDTLAGPRVFEARARALDITFEGRRAVVLLTRDITERVRLEQEQRIAAIAFESQQGMMITDAYSVIIRVNKAFTAITGFSAEEAVGKRTSLLSSGRHDAAFYRAMWARLHADGAWEGEIWNRRRNGEVFPERLSISAVRSSQGLVTHYVAAFMDITFSKAAEDEIRRLAFYDALTGLPNRRLLSDRLGQTMAVSARNGRHGALMFIDLDDFKNVNDLLGHHNGDLLLQKAGARLRDLVRETDTVARFGGDEFVVLLADLPERSIDAAQQAERVAEAMLAALNRPYVLDGQTRQISASIGIAMFAGTTHSIDEMLRRADLSMYESKQLGKNRLQFFDPVMQETVTARLRLEDEIRLGLERDEFVVFYQPQVRDGQGIVSAEALVRWRHPGRGFVPPVQFVPVAERAGLMPQLGRAVMDAALAQLSEWSRAPATSHLSVAINISAAQLYQDGFAESVLDALKRTGAPPTQVMLELTESILLGDIEGAIAVMQTLRSHGVRFSIDDFGTGYSSLGYLQHLPISELKIDRTFVRDLPDNESNIAIVRAVVGLASAIGLSVIAEGVETEEQRASLAAHGCHVFQGYLFARPLPADEFAQLLQDGARADA